MEEGRWKRLAALGSEGRGKKREDRREKRDGRK
jgi:hypothetical protein